jgi:DNA polymerase III epsilon subunit-like protein
MYLVFDTETTGLPQFTKYRGYFDPKDVKFYDRSRILSISWILIDDKTLEESEPQTYYIKPDNFTISPESILIHGITEEIANERGVPISIVFDAMKRVMPDVTHIIAHNISFDVNVLASECYRYGQNALATQLRHKQRYCTMAEGKKILRLTKNPKLGELFHTLFGKHIENAHDAKYDTMNCSQCFLALARKTTHQPKPEPEPEPEPPSPPMNPSALDSEQLKVVLSPNGENTAEIVVACAGSGKTTTIVHRINHLVTHFKVPEETIILTTFTRNAAKNMRRRLAEVLGHDPGVTVGTFDSLSLLFVTKHGYDVSDADVSEYSAIFVEFLRSNEGKSFCKTVTNLFIDEFQDINDVQFEIIKLFHESGTSITCVGDDAQSIYAFRDSNVGYMRDFNKHFQGCTNSTISTNYRCATPIIDVANASIKSSPDGIQKEMRPPASNSRSDPKPTVTCLEDRNGQYAYILRSIQDRMRKSGGTLRDDIAVLCPQNKFLYELEDMLLRNGIPTAFVDANAVEDDKIKVRLTTIHKSKGLEWDIVYIMMMSNDILPMSKAPCDVSEGRRLFYVAITRARRALHVCYSPVYHNNINQTQITKYIAELDPQLFDFRGGVQACHFSSKEASGEEDQKKYIGTECPDYATMLNMLKKSRSQGKTMPVTTTKVYDEIPYLDFIATQDICHEFDAFVKLYVHRTVCITHGCDITCRAAADLLNTVYLDYNENNVYTQYQKNFDNSLEQISMIVRGSNIFKKRTQVMDVFLENPSTEIAGDLMSIVLRILRKLEKKSRAVGLPLHEINIKKQKWNQVGGGSHVNENIIDRLTKHMKVFCDPTCDPEEAVWATWQVSLCERMLNSRRRRGLHANVVKDDVMRYARLFQLITEHFLPQLETITKSKDVEFDTIHGCARIGNCLYETVICGQEQGSIILETKARMMCAKASCPTIDTFVIFNPMKGEILTYDVKSFSAT